MSLADIRAAIAAKKLAPPSLTAAELEEETARAELAKLTADELDVARRRRALELEGAIDAAKAANPRGIFQALDLEDECPGAGHYVLRAAGKADWAAAEKAMGKPGGMTSAESKTFVLKCIVFPDVRDEDTGLSVQAQWDERPAAVVSLVNSCSKLSGLKMTEDAKRAR